MRKRIIFFSMLALLLSAEHAIACSCLPSPPVCEAYKNTPAIFIALVTDIDRPVKDAREAPYAHFTIEHAFKGITETRIKMYQGTATGDCSLKFDQGKRYLIYADYDAETKQFYTSFCTRTTELPYAAQDLDYLRRLPESSRGTLLSGLAVKSDFIDSPEDLSLPELLSGITVSAEQENGKRFEAVTNNEGFFKMVDLPPGRYKLNATLPSHLIADEQNPRVVEVPKVGCASAVFLARTDGRVSGMLLDARGKAIPNIYVELVPFELAHKLNDRGIGKFVGRVEETDKDGRFEFESLKPGRYLMGVNIDREPEGRNPFRPTFFPGVPDRSTAEIITLGKGEKLTGVELRMPPRLRVIEIQGVVVWPDGRPVAKAHLDLKNTSERTEGRSLASARSDDRGRFTLTTLEGQHAWLHFGVFVSVERGLDVMEGIPVRVVTNSKQRPLRLVITRKGRGGLEILPFPKQ